MINKIGRKKRREIRDFFEKVFTRPPKEKNIFFGLPLSRKKGKKYGSYFCSNGADLLLL